MANLAAVALLLIATGCAHLESIDRGIGNASRTVAPPHPVTGMPVLNVVSEEEEIRRAQGFWAEISSRAARQGFSVDPAGPRLNRIRTVFARLTAVAHRQSLPWEVHLVGSTDVNAFTPGGGLVVVLDGLFGGLIPPDDDQALAAVLAHEIAHITMLHVPTGTTWRTIGPLVSESADDPYYQAAYTTEQEAEADRLSVLYLALAGFDPGAPSRVWAAAHQRRGSSAARARFLHDHPLNAERMVATAEAAAYVEQYRIPRKQNPEWESILAHNVLFPRAPDVGSGAGSGILRAGVAALETYSKHQRAKDEEEARKEAAKDLERVKIVRSWRGATADGRAGIYLDIQNISDRRVTGVGIAVHYVDRGRLVWSDESCRPEVRIPPGSQARVVCYERNVPGSTRVVPELVDVRWRR